MASTEAVTPSPRWFGYILLALVAMTFLSFVAMIVLGIALPDPSSSQGVIEDDVSKVLFGCLGALIGAIGGKFST